MQRIGARRVVTTPDGDRPQQRTYRRSLHGLRAVARAVSHVAPSATCRRANGANGYLTCQSSPADTPSLTNELVEQDLGFAII